MKFSNNYLFYPDNKALEQALVDANSLMPEGLAEKAGLDSKVTVADNFLHTRGYFDQHRFSSNILQSAREALEGVLTEEYRDKEPIDWASTQNSLGNVLAALAQQQCDVELYKQAIESFNNATEVYTQTDTPSDWAATQYNLGTAMLALGSQEDDTKVLKSSIDAYTDVLLVWSRDNDPLDWALTMHQLGAVFHVYGRLLKGNRTLQKSVVAYKNALAGFDADTTALELVATHNNRGAVLQNLAESEDNSGRLEEAIRSYETARTVCMEQQLPIHIAVLCRVNKATAKAELAELTKNALIAEEVGDDFEVILELFQASLQPLCLVHCELQLKKAKALEKELSGNS